MKVKRRGSITLTGVYLVFVAVSFLLGYRPGELIARKFVQFALDMLKILPCAFVLVGLFEVWVEPGTVQRHLGERAGREGYLWAVLLASTTVGGFYVALPVAYTLYTKGARLEVIFTYIGASAICRVPMTVFEASFLGPKFSIVRLVVSLPLVILSSKLLGAYLEKRDYAVQPGR